jgi:WD40 repeat protein
VSFDPRGHWLATGGADGTVRLWNLSSAKLTSERLATLEGAADTVVVNPDGQAVLTASTQKGDAFMWSLPSEGGAHDVWKLPADAGVVSGAAFSSDGRWLITRSYDRHTVSIWPLSLEALVKVACRTAGRNLTAHEWRQYFADQPPRSTCDLTSPGPTDQKLPNTPGARGKLPE